MKYLLFALSTLWLLAFSGILNAQQQPSIDDLFEMSIQELMNVKVTVGSRGEAKTTFHSLVPVKVISAKELEASGFINTGEAIQCLLPSFIIYRTSVTDGTDHIAPSSFKGMAPDQTLILINGKRWHQSALLNMNGTFGRGTTSTDFDAIPLGAIDRIEILPDGASAQYGSDAIAGIINIVLKRNSKSSAATYLGQTHKKDGRTEAFHINLNFSAKDRYQFNIFTEYKDRGATNRAGIYPRQQYFDGDPRNDDPAILNRVRFQYGDAESNDFNLMHNLKFTLDSNTHIYSFSLISLRRGSAAGFFRRPLDDRTVRAIYPDGFLPLITPTISDHTLTLGMVHDQKDGYKIDASMIYSTNRFDFYVKNSVNASYGIESPTRFYCGTQKSDQFVFNTDFFRTIQTGFSNPLELGIGLEFRQEAYSILEGDEASYQNGGVPILDGPNAGQPAPIGAQVFPGYSPENAVNVSRTNLGLYVDVESNITQKIRTGLTGRFENYSDFGKTYNGKISLAYKTSKKLILKSSVSTGFRAPALSQSYFGATTSTYTAGDLFNVGTFNVEHPLAKALGAKPLKPEKSKHFSIGSIYRPAENFELQGEFYMIDLKNKIIITEDFVQDSVVFGPDIPTILNNFNAAGARYFTNALNTLTKGFNISVKNQMNLNQNSSLLFNLGHHYNKSKIIGNIKTPDILRAYETNIISPNDISRITAVQPNHISYLDVKYYSGYYSLFMKIIRYGDYQGDLCSSGQRCHYGSEYITNISGQYKYDGHLSIHTGINNIFNVYPDKRQGEDLLPSILQYSNYSVFAFRGSVYYLKLNYIF